MTDPTLRQQAIQLLAASGLQPTAQNLQRVQALIANGAYGNGSNGGDTNRDAGTRTLDRVSGTSVPPSSGKKKVISRPAPVSTPNAAQGNQAGSNSTGPAQEPGADAAGVLDENGEPNPNFNFDYSNADVAAPVGASPAVDPPTVNADNTEQTNWGNILAAIGIGGAGVGAGAVGLNRMRLRDKPVAATTGDIYPDPHTGSEMEAAINSARPATAGDVGVGETAGTEMDPAIKAALARTMEEGDLNASSDGRQMVTDDIGEAPAMRRMIQDNPADVSRALRATNRVINEGMSVVPKPAPAPAIVADPGIPADSSTMTEGDLAGVKPKPKNELAGDPTMDPVIAKDADQSLIKANIDIENSGFDNLDEIISGGEGKINAFVNQLAPKEVYGMIKILQRNSVPAMNATDIRKALIGMRRVIKGIR